MIFYPSALPIVASSPQCCFGLQPTNSQKTVSETHQVFPQYKQHQVPFQQSQHLTRPMIDLNTNPYHQEAKSGHFDNPVIAVDTRLLQAQSHYGAVGVAAAAMAAHRHSGAVQYGLS